MNPNCKGVIPGTFIICGEGEEGMRQFCSEECLRAAEEMKKREPKAPAEKNAS